MFSLLYIDDEPGLLELGQLFLERTGEFTVTTALSADAGLACLAQRDFDAIISDYQMPGMDGIELLKNVRKSFGTVPFILFTGRGREEIVIEAINNGVDFYLQKGGAPQAQFAELAHKVQQAVTRRRAETALSDSEKRLADIINFLPDATFAIDTDGKVIAWNRAIEEMTGISADAMLGKGEYEYAVPFYGTRRRILIDLVFEPEKETREHYTGITREKDVLIAETDLPRPRGMRRTLMGKASPLYNRKGRVVGAIESIRDITQKKETEAALQEQNRVLARMNQLSLELAAIPTQENIREFAIKKLVEMTGAVAAWFCDYDTAGRILTISHLEVTPPLLKEATRLLGKLPEEVRTPVSEDLYRKIINSRVLKFSTLTEVSFGEVSPVVSRSIQALAGVDRFYGLAYVIEGNLYGTSVLALKKGQGDPSKELLESFAHIMAVSLSRRNSEERLAASEEKFRTVADYTYGWEYWEGPDRSMVYMSPSCERISGYSTGDFYRIPRLLDSIVDPRDREIWEDHRKTAETTTTALSMDFRIVRKDGGIRWINHICHPVIDAGGRHQGRRASNRDITEKKQKDDELQAAYEQLTASQEELQGQYEELASGEQRIRESEEKFRTFMETSIDGVMLIDVTGNILTWNLAQEQIFGIPALEAIGSNIIDIQERLIVPEHKTPAYIEGLRSQFTTSNPELFSRKAPQILEMEVMNVRGHRITILQTLFPIQTSSGKRIGCISREVTEQRNAEKNLRESEAKYRELAELLPQIVFEMDPAFRITFANQKALTTMDLTEKDLEAGVSALSFIDHSDHERVRQNIEKIFRGEPVEHHEYTAVRRDGSTFPAMIYAAPISRSGKPAGIRGILIDITGQKRTENALRESELFLKETQGIARLGGWKANPHTDYLEWTDGIYDIVEAPRNYRPGLTEGMKYYAPEDIPVIREKVAACLETGEPFSLEVTITTETGKKVWTELRGLAPVIEGARSYVIGTFQDITERKLNEDTLRESEERFKTLFEKSAESQLLLDGTGKVADCNAALLTLFALKDKEEIRGHSLEDFAPEFQPDGVRSSTRGDEIFASVMKEGMVQYEWAHQKHDPARTPILTEVICTIIQIAGQPMIHASIRDITDRKKAEDALREREATLASIFRAAPVGIGMVSDRVLMKVNDRLCEMTGYSAGELIGKSARILYPNEEEFERVGREKYEQIRNYGTGTVETRWQRKDGDIRDVLLSSTPLDPENHGIGVTFTALDITERKRAEEALLKHQQQLEEITGTIPMVVYQFYARPDGTMGLYYVSSRAPEVFGISSNTSDFFERFTRQVDPRDRETLLNSINEAVRQRSPWNFEGRFVKPSGETIWFQGISRPFTGGTEIVFSGVLLDITERKKAEAELLSTYQNLTATEEELRQQYEELAQNEERLRVSEEKFRTLVETTSDFIWEVDESGTYTYVSPQVRELLGYEPEELIGKTPFDFMQPDEARRVTAVFTRLIGSRLPISSLEKRCIHKNGSIVVLETSGVPRLAKDGSFAGYRGIDRNITRRKHAEEALKESEEKYRTILDTTSEWIWDLGLDGRHTYSNNAVESLLGYTVDEFLGFRAFDLMHPEDKKQVETIFTASVKEKKGWRNLVTQWQHKDGTYRYLESNATTIFNERGELTGFRVADRDITGRKQAEEAIQKSEAALQEKSAMLEALFNAIPDVIGVQDLHHGILRYNAAGYEMVGKNPSEVAGKRCFELIGHDAACEICATSETYRTKKPAMVQKYVPEINAWLDVRSYPVLDETGEIRFIIEHLRDISDRKKAAAELQSAYQNLTATEEELRGQYEELARNEERLRESEEKYRTLVESSFDGIAIHQDGILVYVNRTAARLLGSDDPGVFIGRSAIDLVAPAFREQIMKRIREAPEKPMKLIHEQFQRLDGTAIDVDVTSTPGTWKGKPAAFVTFRDITKQKHAEAALRESESRWKQWIEQSPIPIGLYLLDGTGIYSNVHFVRIIGYTLDEIPDTETYWRTMFPDPQYRQEIKMAWEDHVKTSIVRGGNIEPLEARISCRDGVTRMLEFTGLVIGDTILVTYYDLTTRKKAQDALHESEEKYRALVEVNRDIIYSLDTDGTILYSSPQITAQLGYMPDEVVGHNFSEIIHPDDIGSLVRHIRENFIPGKPVAQDQFRLRRIDGTYRWYEDKSIYATDHRGRNIVSGTIRDITEEKTAQDALRESEEKFRALVETTSDFIWEVNAAGVYTYVSPQVYQILGYEPDEMVGRTPFNFMLPEEIEKVTAEFNHCITSRLQIVALENKAIRKDGSVVVLETSGVVQTANDGRYLGYRGIDRDITTRKEATERTTRISTLKQDLLRTAPLEGKLKQITDGIVEIFGADFARIWMSGPGDLCDKGCIHAGVTKGPHVCRNRKSCLHLIASSGRYTHTDGDHRRVPFGAYKIGRLATGEMAQFITNDVTHDPRVHDHAWAESLGLVSFSGFQLVSPDGDPIGVLAFFSQEPITQDIVDDLNDLATTTSLVIQTGMAEDAQREREEWARTILNTAQTGIVLIDAETHRLLDANPKALGMIGLPRDSVIGRVCHHFICPAEKDNCPVTDGGQVVDTSERILVTASGTMIPILKTVVSVSLGGKKVLVESFVDISEQKRSEAAIREANRKLNLLSSITRHDVANQLTVIQGYTQLAALSNPEPVIADFLAKIESGIDTIQRQVEFTRTYQDLGVQAPSWFVIGDVIRSVGHEGIKLVCTCKSYEIYADPMIGRVFFNLFDNAARYGERVTTVRVGCAKKGKKLVIRFADNGIGIPSVEKKKIFLKGYGKHTGFGLFLAREILAITGITIQETGTYGKGAVFEITVPEGSFQKAD